jgi:hypothetical protein
MLNGGEATPKAEVTPSGRFDAPLATCPQLPPAGSVVVFSPVSHSLEASLLKKLVAKYVVSSLPEPANTP